jgi:carboxymethylenebutenolidase
MNRHHIASTLVIAAAVVGCNRSAEVRTAAAPSAIAIVQQEGSTPPSNSEAAAKLAASPRKGEWVKLPWGDGKNDSLMAWIVYPQNLSARSKAPVVVVVHEIFGLSTWVRSVADDYAARGFIAIAPDLASRIRGGPSTVELTSDSAGRIFRSPGIPMVDRNAGIVSVANYAMSRPNAIQKYGVVGFCWGGQTTWGHAVHGGAPGFAGGVAYYGVFPYGTPGPAPAGGGRAPSIPVPDSLAKIRVPMMLLNGSGDAGISAQMPYLDSMMTAMHKPYFGRNYPGAEHGFARQQGDQKAKRDTAQEKANVAAIKDAWPRTIKFFNDNLRK